MQRRNGKTSRNALLEKRNRLSKLGRFVGRQIGAERPLAAQGLELARAIDARPGGMTSWVATAAASSSRVNQRASASSTPSTTTSVDNAVARKPSMSEAGNGHGWLPR